MAEVEKSSLKYRFSSLSTYWSYDKLVQNIPFILFAAVLAMFYIWNTYYSEKTRRDIDVLKRRLKEQRWYYVSAKSDLMFKSKQSEVAKIVEPNGLKELSTPPKKIVIKKNGN